MPFLERVDPWDVVAVESMRKMLWNDEISAVFNHPAIRDGITDEEARVVAVLYRFQRNNPDILQVLLDPGQIQLEERTIYLPMRGETILNIIRLGPGVKNSMDHLEDSLKIVEAFMGTAVPTNFVVILFEETILDSNGVHRGSYIAIKPKLKPRWELHL